MKPTTKSAVILICILTFGAPVAYTLGGIIGHVWSKHDPEGYLQITEKIPNP